MKTYLQDNYEYWQKGYEAENVESFVFRTYGRIFIPEFGLDGSNNEKLLDFGCGSGANLNFFHQKGFDVYGVDISHIDIERCKKRMNKIASHFSIIDSQPKTEDIFFGGEYDVVIAIQALYYFSDADFKVRMESIYKQMKKGAIIYATMMGPKCDWFYDNSVEAEDGLRKVDFSTGRVEAKDYYVNFTENEEDLVKKFELFKPIHIGHYEDKIRQDEGTSFHYTFIGQKV
jgi:cyclopropane fatty-acyl-phospholipid synthase-like methyltransferase